MDLEEQLAQAQTEYQRVRSDALSMVGRLTELSAEVTSEDGLFTMTADAQGQITEVVVHHEDYRLMTQEELAGSLFTTISDLQAELRAKVFELLPQSPLAGVSTEDMMSGKLDLTKLFPEDILSTDLGIDRLTRTGPKVV